MRLWVASGVCLEEVMTNLQLDGNKLIHHLDRVNEWTKTGSTTPVYVAFSPTSYCNHHCIFCVYHYKEFKPIFFPLDRYQEMVKEWKMAGVRSVFFAGDGDPLLNKSCHEMIAATRAAGIDIALNSNGRLLNAKNIPIFARDLSFIRISMNAGTRENYAHIHGTQASDFDAVVENLKKLVAEKKLTGSPITIGVQCVLLSHNQNEIKQLAELVKSIGVDYLSIKPFLKHPEIKFDDTIENLDQVLDDLIDFGKQISGSEFNFVLRKTLFLDKFERSYKQCLSTDFMIEIDALGDVYSCGPYIGDESHKLGNVMKTSFGEFWNSDRALAVRKHVRCNVDVSKCMPFCRPNSVNEFLWQIKTPPQHVNYI